MPIEEFIGLVEAHPDAAGRSRPRHRGAIRTIDLTGGAGVAVLVETDDMGSDVVEDFDVARIDGDGGSEQDRCPHEWQSPRPRLSAR